MSNEKPTETTEQPGKQSLGGSALTHLLDCPFCGQPSYLIKKDFESNNSSGFDGFDVVCKTEDCHLEHGADYYFDTKEEAINSWNKRFVKRCEWEFDSDRYYETECGNGFMFIDGSITDNDMKYCPYCNGAIKEI